MHLVLMMYQYIRSTTWKCWPWWCWLWHILNLWTVPSIYSMNNLWRWLNNLLWTWQLTSFHEVPWISDSYTSLKIVSTGYFSILLTCINNLYCGMIETIKEIFDIKPTTWLDILSWFLITRWTCCNKPSNYNKKIVAT